MQKILVVDDDVDILDLVNILLLKSGFIVKTLSSANNMLLAVQSFDPQLILMDINLKGYDGREICKQLKAPEGRFKHIPVILFSAMHNLEENYTECEAVDFIAKPFDGNTLIEKIKSHIPAT